MRILATFLVACLALICGCASKHYLRGDGDAGQFIIQDAFAYSGYPVSTNGLPAIGGDWQFIHEDYGTGILLPVVQFQSVQDFVCAAFGPPSNSAGWSVRYFDVTIMVQKTDSHTLVLIYPPMSDKKKMARWIREMTQDMEKR